MSVINVLFLLYFIGSLTQAIRNFAKSLEGWLKSAMVGVPEEMLKTKVSALVSLEIFFLSVAISLPANDLFKNVFWVYT